MASGTTFVVSIPLGSGHLPTAQIALGTRRPSVARSMYPAVMEAGRWVQAATPELSGAADTPDRLRILVADDNADMREYLARLLTPHWEVELVADGRAAFDAAIARPPDLVLSDAMMPGMDGVALLRALRGDARTASTPVVLLSARAGEEALLEGIETLADDYLVKPFSARELLARVRTHLRMAEVRQRLQSQLVIADRMSAVGTLAAGVAHEINNPLAYVMSNLDLIAEEVRSIAGGSPSSRMKDLDEMVTEARQGAERVRKIVRGMKTFSRGDEERRTPIDVRPLIDLSINMAFNEIRHRARVVKDFGAMVGTAIRRILGDEHDVTVLSDGQKALDLLLDGNRFDVILCDLMMPQVTGMDIHAALSSDVPELTHRMVFVTGGAFTPTAQRFLDTIPNQRLEKPFSSQNLRALVRGFVHQSLRPSARGEHTHA